MEKHYVGSEIGQLRSVMLHRPNLSLKRLTPSNCQELLFDDVLSVERAGEEHDIFANTLELTAAAALSVFRFMMNKRTWQFCRQRSTLGLFFSLRWSVYNRELSQFYFNGGKVTLNEFIQ